MKIKLLLILFLIITGRVQAQRIVAVEIMETFNINMVGDKYSITDNEGKILLNNIDSVAKDQHLDFYWIKKNNMYGIYSLYYGEIIPIQFDEIKSISRDRWLVRKDQKKGIYDIRNEQNLPAIFDEIKYTHEDEEIGYYRNDARLIVCKDSKFGIYDENFNEVIPIIYDNIVNRKGFIRYGSFAVGTGFIELQLENEKSYLLGGRVINKNILIKETFRIDEDRTKIFYIYEDQNKLGIIDKNGLIVIEPIYDDITYAHLPYNTNVLFVKKDLKWGAIDSSNETMLPIAYESIRHSENSNYLVIDKNNVHQIFDLKNNRILDNITFEKYGYFKGYYQIEKDEQQTLIDITTMQLVFPFKYQSIRCLEDLELFLVKANDRYGIIDTNEKVIIPIIYEEFTDCGNKAVVKNDGKYGIIDYENRILWPFTDCRIAAYYGKFMIYREDGTWEMFDSELNKTENK